MSPESFASMCRQLPRAQENDDLADAKDGVAALFRREQKANFGNTENEDGSAWPPRVDNETHPLLYLTGKMYAATTDKNAAGNVTQIEHRSMTLGVDGSEVPYAVHHHYGAPRANLPKRRFLYWRKDKLKRAGPIIKTALRRIYERVSGASG